MKKKIIFYSSIDRNFRSTLLGYLIELQTYKNLEIIFLYEDLEPSLFDFLHNKISFPNIIEFIYIGQYANENIFSLHKFKKLNSLAKRVIDKYTPSLVITSSDFHSIFELFICKYAKSRKSSILSIACSNSLGDMKQIAKWIKLYTINTRYKRVPKYLAILVVLFRKYLAHFSAHYLFPLFSGSIPLSGASSYLLYRGQSGMRDATFQIVFSEQEKQHFEVSGVDRKKIFNVRHPYFSSEIRKTLKSYFSKVSNIDFLILHSAELIGFNSNNFSIIDIETRIEANIEIFKTIRKYFPDKSISIKLHPNVSPVTVSYLKSRYCDAVNAIQFIDPNISIELLLLNSKVLIDLPRPVSTSVFMHTLINPSGLSISLNLFQEFLGDYYANNSSVEYITSLRDFDNLLLKFKKGLYENGWDYGRNKFDYTSLTDLIEDKSLFRK